MRKLVLSGLLLAWMIGPAVDQARAQFQIDIALTGASPIGEYSDGSQASDFFGTGGGLIGDVLFGLGDSLRIGGQVGVYSNSGDDFEGDYTLTSIPVHGLVQYSAGGEETIGFFAQGGVGFTSHSIEVDSVFGNFSESQSSLSFILGGGVVYPLSETWGLTGGLHYHQAQTPDDCFDNPDKFFCDDDNPKSLLFTLGARWRSVQ